MRYAASTNRRAINSERETKENRVHERVWNNLDVLFCYWFVTEEMTMKTIRSHEDVSKNNWTQETDLTKGTWEGGPKNEEREQKRPSLLWIRRSVNKPSIAVEMWTNAFAELLLFRVSAGVSPWLLQLHMCLPFCFMRMIKKRIQSRRGVLGEALLKFSMLLHVFKS